MQKVLYYNLSFISFKPRLIRVYILKLFINNFLLFIFIDWIVDSFIVNIRLTHFTTSLNYQLNKFLYKLY